MSTSIPSAVLDAAAKAISLECTEPDWSNATLAQAALEAANIAQLQAAADALPGLVAALKRCEQHLMTSGNPHDGDDWELMQDIRAALAAAKGATNAVN